jgi:hypothetical protein
MENSLDLDELLGINQQSIRSESEIQATRNTKGLVALGAMPGELSEDGSYIDAYGFKHYPYGIKYKIAPEDKRLTANGAFSGKQIRMQFSDEELQANPFLGLDPRAHGLLNGEAED